MSNVAQQSILASLQNPHPFSIGDVTSATRLSSSCFLLQLVAALRDTLADSTIVQISNRVIVMLKSTARIPLRQRAGFIRWSRCLGQDNPTIHTMGDSGLSIQLGSHATHDNLAQRRQARGTYQGHKYRNRVHALIICLWFASGSNHEVAAFTRIR